MTNATYNGWTNYATWRINLEIFDGWDYSENGFHGLSTQDKSDVYDLSEYLKEYAREIIFEQSKGLAMDYALAFLNDVNWYEIAEHMIEEVEA